MEQQEVDLGRAKGKDTLDEAFTTHLCVGVCPEDVDCVVRSLSHKIDGAVCIFDHSLSYHFNAFGDGHVFELDTVLHVVWIE